MEFLSKSAKGIMAAWLLSAAGLAQAQYGVVEQLVLSPGTITDRSLVEVQVKGLLGSPCEIIESKRAHRRGRAHHRRHLDSRQTRWPICVGRHRAAGTIRK
jgi:hypothetical protein